MEIGMDNITSRVSYMLLGIMTYYGFFSNQTFLKEHRISLLIMFILIPLLAYFHVNFKRNTYHGMVKKFEMMSVQQFLNARKTYARLSMESMRTYRDVEPNRIIKKHNLDENEINLWLRECLSKD
jgi:hypothetical protein